MRCRCVSFLNMYYIAPRLRAKACAPENSAAGDDTSQISKAVLWRSAATIYVIGFFVAYALGTNTDQAGPQLKLSLVGPWLVTCPVTLTSVIALLSVLQAAKLPYCSLHATAYTSNLGIGFPLVGRMPLPARSGFANCKNPS